MAEIRTGLLCVAVILGSAACADSTRVSPTPPPPPPSQTPTARTVPPPAAQPSVFLPDVTLSGSVYELVGDPLRRVGIEGAVVYCEQCEASTHSFATTDSKGAYVFLPGFWDEGRPAFPARISVTKDGFRDPIGRPLPTPPNPTGAGWREAVVDGKTPFDVELVRLP